MTCTCDVKECVGVVHEGDCPMRCTYWQRDYHSNGIAQCTFLSDHGCRHSLGLYRGSPSRRRERGVLGDVPVPTCAEAVPASDKPCPYYYLEPDNACPLPRGHRETHANPGDREPDWSAES